MQNRNDFEERIRTTKAEIAALLAGEREVSAGTHLKHTIYLTARCQRNHPATEGREPLNRKERSNYEQQIKPVEEILLKQWAQENNLWQTEALFNQQHASFLDQGAEQMVYLNRDKKSVVKVNTGNYHGTWLSFFVRLLLHQVIFPSTQYKLIGFTDQDSQFAAILEQPFVDVIGGPTTSELESHLLPLGFIRIRNYDFYNRKHGLLLEDLHDENVLMNANGVLFFIDPVIYLETPDLGFDGPSQFHFPF